MQDDDGLSLPIGGVIEDVYITAPVSRGGDGITVYGDDGPVVIRNCTVDLGRCPWTSWMKASPAWTGLVPRPG